MDTVGVNTLLRLLVSKVGFNSISALIEKYGWDAIKSKFEFIKA